MDRHLAQRIFNKLFGKNLNIQIKVFNILALSGISVCTLLFLYGLFAGETTTIMICYLLGIAFSVTMLYYTLKTGKYKTAMTLTVFAVFLVMFTFIFFNGGGYNSGAPIFFVFAMVFTAFLLSGKTAVILIILEVVWYSFICIYAYENPTLVRRLNGEKEIMYDVLACAMVAGLVLAITMYLQTSVYRAKQAELTAAKEEADKANSAKSTFLARMSHDIRTPLNTVMAMNELISQNSESEDILEWTADIENACLLLLSQINDLLDVSKIELGQVDIHENTYLVKDLIHKLYINWDREAHSKGLTLEFDISGNFPSKLYGSEDSIYKILSNLIGNAIKYSDQGKITISFLQKDESQFQFIVADEGIGIPEEFLDKIFVPFERGAQEYYYSREGSGLGLAIVKELANQMAADISCESKVGVGSRFTLFISQKVVDTSPIGSIYDCLDFRGKEDKAADDFIIPGGSILVVDDNFYNRKVLRAFLEPILVSVDDVESGEEALEMIEIKDYDLILMDYRMPDMSGEETLGKIKECVPDFETPVVVITADAMAGTKERLLNAGFDDFITKPVNSGQLKNILRTYLSGKVQCISQDDAGEAISNLLDAYESKLDSYDISMSKAIQYNDDRLDEWLIRIESMLELYEAVYEKIQNAVHDKSDLENMYYTVHSLKSTAKGIGADTLAQLAAIMERKNDTVFLETMIPALMKEYELVNQGCQFIMKEIANRQV